MKTSVNLYQFREAFRTMDRKNFSYEGLEVLFDYLETYEDDTGEEIELDVVSICCDYMEDTFVDIASNYSVDIDGMDEGEVKEAVMSYLTDNTQIVCEVGEDSVIYLAF